ncbi:hypothetical protein JCM1841_005669 [Sporobolomyces salmonicolor]
MLMASTVLNPSYLPQTTSTSAAVLGGRPLPPARASLDTTSSIYSDPFREPSLEYASSAWSSSARSASHSPGSADRYPSGASSSRSPSSEMDRVPPLPTSRSTEISKALAMALEEELPQPAAAAPAISGRTRSGSGATLKKGGGAGRGNASPSFVAQFRTGSGWFAPLVEPERELTPEELAAKEHERIEKLKLGRESKSTRRPGLMKRLSSGMGVELKGFGGMGSPTK